MSLSLKRPQPTKIFLCILLAIVILFFTSRHATPSFYGEDVTEPFLSGGDDDAFGHEGYRDHKDVAPEADRPKVDFSPDQDGLLAADLQDVHPIFQLVYEGDRKWQNMVKRQSKTLWEAITEYKRRYGREPPPGFDEWYTFATKKKFLLIDEFDQINEDIKGVALLPHEVLLERLAEAKRGAAQFGASLHIFNNASSTVEMHGPSVPQERNYLLQAMVAGFSRYLPEMDIYINREDSAPRVLGSALKERLKKGWNVIPAEELAQLEDLTPQGGDIFSACDNPAQLRQKNQELKSPITTASHKFVYDQRALSDFCDHPELVHLHGVLTLDHRQRESRIYPEFVWTKQPSGSELRLPSLQNHYQLTLMPSRPWNERKQNKVFWRGISVGSYHMAGDKLYGWQGASHRARAAFTFANESVITGQDWISNHVSLLTVSQTGNLSTKIYDRSALNKLYTDIGLVGPVMQCDENDGTCAQMEKQVPWKEPLGTWATERGSLKYVLDLDGNGLSGEFQRGMGFGSVVMRSSIFPLWNSNWVIPYYHYIPIQPDYSDVYDIMAFFAGTPVEEGGILKVDESKGHDALAKRIGENAQRFVKQTWRWEDMQVYMYRLLLEYNRVISESKGTVDTVDYLDI